MQTSVALGATGLLGGSPRPAFGDPVRRGKLPVAVSSANGLRAVEKAIAMVEDGQDPLDAGISPA